MQKIHKNYWPNNSVYFITGSTFLHYPYFKSDEKKQILLNQIKRVRNDLDIPVSAYSISINHDHIIVFINDGKFLSKIKQIIHGGTSYKFKKNYTMRYDEMRQSSRAYVITNDEMNDKIACYVNGNLLKHKEVNTFKELYNNRFSSYCYYINKYGEEYSKDLIYKVINTTEESDGNVNLNELNKVNLNQPSAKAG